MLGLCFPLTFLLLLKSTAGVGKIMLYKLMDAVNGHGRRGHHHRRRN